MRELALIGVVSGGEQVIQEPFEPGHLLVPLRQRPGRHEHAAKVREDRARRQAVEFGVGELPAACGDVGQECGDEVFREPAQGCDGPPCSGQRLVQRMQGGADGAAGAGQQLGQPPVEPAVRALARAACPACGAAEAEHRAGAGAAEGLIQGAGPDRLDVTAAGAARPPLLAGEAPRLAGEPGDPARRAVAADRADQNRQRRGAPGGAHRQRPPAYDAGCAARLELVATLRELGLGLADVRRVLENKTTVAEVAAVHVEALDAQIRTLRLRRAVLAAVAKRRPGMEEVTLMNKLAKLSAQERRQIIDDFAAEVFHGLDPDPGLAAHLRKATPDLTLLPNRWTPGWSWPGSCRTTGSASASA